MIYENQGTIPVHDSQAQEAETPQVLENSVQDLPQNTEAEVPELPQNPEAAGDAALPTLPAEPASFDRKEGRNGPFTEETLYSTRYFVIRYDDEGNLAQIELEHIASVTKEDAEEFLQVAQE